MQSPSSYYRKRAFFIVYAFWGAVCQAVPGMAWTVLFLIKDQEEAMYNKVETNLNFVEREKQTEQFWKDNKIFKKSMDNRKDGETYT